MDAAQPGLERGGVLLDAGTYELILQLRDANRSIAMWTKLRDDVRAQLIKILDGHETGHRYGRRIITVERRRPRRFDSHAFAEDHPHLYEQYRAAPDHDEIRLEIAKDLVEYDNDGKVPPEANS